MTIEPLATRDRPVAHTAGAPTAAPLLLEKCIVCGGRQLRSVFSGRFDWLRRCRDCGLQFASPQPADDELQAIYDEDYCAKFGYAEEHGGAYHDLKRAAFSRLLERIERRLPKGSLLDAGTALGDLPVVARERGWEAVGIEPHRFASAEDVRQTQPVIPSSVEEYQPGREPYDVVTCCDVLEHLRRPDDALERFHSWLRPGGGLVVTTINRKSPAARLLGRRWFHIHREHLWYFDRTALCRLAVQAGFDVLECRTAQKVFNFQYLLSILRMHGGFRTLQRCSEWGLRTAPRWLLTRRFLLREGLLLMARRS